MAGSFKTRRDLAALETFEADNHNYTTSDYTSTTAASTLFANYNNVSCILTPEVTEGPYYVTGEYIRSDVTDGQEGVPVHLEYQYIDVSTCEVVEGLYVDTWQANATGVYSGVQASGNGNEDDASNLVSLAPSSSIQPLAKLCHSRTAPLFVECNLPTARASLRSTPYL